jgi:MoaA/NifB/PqqE/SkfB family radical SAM enzyme
MSFETFEHVISEWNHAESVVFTGGEPTLSKHFEKIMDFSINEMGLNVGLLTSGHSFSKTDWKRWLNATTWTRFSIDSLEPKLYKSLRRRDLKDVIPLLEMAADIAPHKHRINFTIMKENIESIMPTIKLADKLGIDAAFCMERTLKNDIFLQKDYKLISRIACMLNSGASKIENIKVYAYEVFEMPTFMKMTGEELDALMKAPCVIPAVYAMIMTNGDYFPCCYLSFNTHMESLRKKRQGGKEGFSLGNVFKLRPRMLYEEMNTSWKQIWKHASQSAECRTCGRYLPLSKLYHDTTKKPVFF